jgi:hypothetical protein
MQGVKISELRSTPDFNSTDFLILWRPGIGNGNTYKILGSVFSKSSEITDLETRATNLETEVATLQTGKVSLSGDSMSGKLTLNANPTQPLHAATKQYVDSKADTAAAAKTWAQLKCS